MAIAKESDKQNVVASDDYGGTVAGDRHGSIGDCDVVVVVLVWRPEASQIDGGPKRQWG